SRSVMTARLMRGLRTHPLGSLMWLVDGALDADRLLLPLPDAEGHIRAWCLALPFLRPAEVTCPTLGVEYLRGIGRVHE
ncbi:exonuclease SbcCD subunit D, partial [Pseudomonas syringae pv. tagetis]